MAAPRILVADDDPWILKMVTTVLEQRSYVVETAEDGEKAYEMAVADPPDLIITDVMMPKVDGWTLVRALRSRPEFSFVPVIFLTALASDDDRIRGFRLGADDYLPKPFRFEELDLRVARTLRYRELIETHTRHQVRAATHDPGAEPAPGLEGKLDQVGLPSLLTLLELEKKSGVLTVAGPGGEAELAFREGRVVRARFTDRAEPKNAHCIYELLGWSSGEFRFARIDVEVDDEVQASTTHLLMEGARRLDELTREPAS
jgi:CheY-like chemotaxis protein